MEMADYWLVEKQLIHKLFKVLAPRYENYNTAFTRMFNVPRLYTDDGYKKAVLELRGNPYPSLLPETHTNRNLIHNVLLDEVKKAYRTEKYKEIANNISKEAQGIINIDHDKPVSENINDQMFNENNKESYFKPDDEKTNVK